MCIVGKDPVEEDMFVKFKFIFISKYQIAC